jgi:hypothetical protein
MNKVIVRDDDISFFTSPDLLERVYGRLWSRHKPVCLSVIPAQNSNVRIDYRPGKPFDPSIPPRYRGQDHDHTILNNRELCAYLNEKARQGLVEICLHGYSHSYMEYTIEESELINSKLEKGMCILHEAFPDAPIKTFIAPYDVISPVALRRVIECDMHICTNSSNLKAFPEFKQMGNYQQTSLQSGKRLYTCDEYLFTHRDDPQQSLQNAYDRLLHESPLTITNHHWTFFHDWQNKANDLMLDHWNQLVDKMLSDRDIEITTFSTYS